MTFKSFKSRLASFPTILLITIVGTALYGLYGALKSSVVESAAVLWLWGVVILGMSFYKDGIALKRGTKMSAICGYIVALSSFVAAFFGYTSIAVFFACVAPVIFFYSKKTIFAESVSIFIWTVLVAHTEYLHFFFSYPMRYFSAGLTSTVLWALGFDAVSNGSIINISGVDIAITAACSGVEQLEPMLLIGWVVAVSMQRSAFLRTLQFLLVLPIIVLANSLRLAITLGGYCLYGNVFLSDALHTALGYALLVAITGLFYISGRVLRTCSSGGLNKKDGAK